MRGDHAPLLVAAEHVAVSGRMAFHGERKIDFAGGRQYDGAGGRSTPGRLSTRRSTCVVKFSTFTVES